MRSILAVLSAGLFACSSPPDSASTAPAPSQPAQQQSAPTPPAASPKPAAAAAAPADPNEACAQLILIAYRGARLAADHVTRGKDAAVARARELLAKAHTAADFADVAEAESDAPSSAVRGGVIGTFRREDWPPLHAALRDTVFALRVGETASEPVEADYGYALVRRCPVEKASSRHILIRFRGAKNAGPEVTRTKQEAEALARGLLAKLAAGEDFGALARASSEDRGSAEKGGVIGTQGRGLLSLPYETTLFGMQPGERSAPIETEFGLHIIERMPDAP